MRLADVTQTVLYHAMCDLGLYVHVSCVNSSFPLDSHIIISCPHTIWYSACKGRILSFDS